MNSKNKKFSLAIDGSTNILSIAILDKIKIVKVKHYKNFNQIHEIDNYFTNITDFFNHEFEIDTIYVGCGPGSFSGLRKSISFAQAYKFSNIHRTEQEFFSIGINSLACLAYGFKQNNPSSDSKFLLSLIDTGCNDYYGQLYSTENNKYNLPIIPISKIKILSIYDLNLFFEAYSLKKDEIAILGLSDIIAKKNNIDFNCLDVGYKFPSAENIGRMGYIIRNSFFKSNQSFSELDFFNYDLFPIYARAPKTN